MIVSAGLGGARAVMSAAFIAALRRLASMGSADRVPNKRALSKERWSKRADPILVASTVFAILPDHTRKLTAPAMPLVRPAPRSLS